MLDTAERMTERVGMLGNSNNGVNYHDSQFRGGEAKA